MKKIFDIVSKILLVIGLLLIIAGFVAPIYFHGKFDIFATYLAFILIGLVVMIPISILLALRIFLLREYRLVFTLIISVLWSGYSSYMFFGNKLIFP